MGVLKRVGNGLLVFEEEFRFWMVSSALIPYV